jgi:hypothetical protein
MWSFCLPPSLCPRVRITVGTQVNEDSTIYLEIHISIYQVCECFVYTFTLPVIMETNYLIICINFNQERNMWMTWIYVEIISFCNYNFNSKHYFTVTDHDIDNVILFCFEGSTEVKCSNAFGNSFIYFRPHLLYLYFIEILCDTLTP